MERLYVKDKVSDKIFTIKRLAESQLLPTKLNAIIVAENHYHTSSMSEDKRN